MQAIRKSLTPWLWSGGTTGVAKSNTLNSAHRPPGIDLVQIQESGPTWPIGGQTSQNKLNICFTNVLYLFCGNDCYNSTIFPLAEGVNYFPWFPEATKLNTNNKLKCTKWPPSLQDMPSPASPGVDQWQQITPHPRVMGWPNGWWEC